MSYSFLIPGIAAQPQFLRDSAVSYKPVRLRGLRSWLAWRGNPSRGVFFDDTEDGTRIRIPVFASNDDVSLAVDLATAWAARHRVPVDVEEDPPGTWDELTAPSAPTGFPPGRPGQYFTPKQVRAWPRGWHDIQNDEMFWDKVEPEVARNSLFLFSGPHHATAVGEGFLARVFADRALLETSPFRSGDGHRFAEALVAAQDPGLAALPIRPLFTSALLPLLRPLPHMPLATLLTPTIADIAALRRVQADTHFTCYLPREECLLPNADFVALQSGNGDWAAIPASQFLIAMKAFVKPVDDAFSRVTVPAPKKWKQIESMLLAKSESTRIEHNEDFLEAAQELIRRTSNTQGESDDENAAGNRVVALRRSGENEAALVAVEELVTIAPDSQRAPYWRSRALVDLGRFAEAIDSMRVSVSLPNFNRDQHAGSLADLAEQLANQGEHREADVLLGRALEIGSAGWAMRGAVEEYRSALPTNYG